jgi:hypothetical protein
MRDHTKGARIMGINDKDLESSVSNGLAWDRCFYCHEHMDESFIHLDNSICEKCYAKERAHLEPCASCEKPLRCGWKILSCDKALKYLNNKYGERDGVDYDDEDCVD